MTQLVTVMGATGGIGGRVVQRLLEQGASVRALGRDATKLAALAGRGAEGRAGTADDPAFLADAFRGADVVFAIVPENPFAPDVHADKRRCVASIVAALRDAAVPRVVALSAVGVGIGPATALADSEAMLNAVPGLHVTVLRAAWLMENMLASIPLIRQAGINGAPMRGDVPLAMVAKRDIGDLAAALLLDAAAPAGTRYVLGPRDYTQAEATAILGAAIGRPELPYVPFPPDDFRGALLGAGLSPSMADAIVELHVAFDEGRVQAAVRRDAASTTATTLEDFAREVFAPAFSPPVAAG
jgi:uncharacterized protein YbjT (DUF2867 family)